MMLVLQWWHKEKMPPNDQTSTCRARDPLGGEVEVAAPLARAYAQKYGRTEKPPGVADLEEWEACERAQES